MRLATWIMLSMACMALVLSGCGEEAKTGGRGSGSGSATPAAATGEACCPHTAAVAVNLDSPRAALESLDSAFKSGDLRVVSSLVPPDFKQATGKRMAAMSNMIGRQAEAKKAVSAKLGDEVANQLWPAESSIAGFSPLGQATTDGKVDWTRINIKEEGDKATVAIDNVDDDDLTLSRIDGKWYVNVGKQSVEQANKEAEDATKSSEKMVKALDQFVKLVNDGKVTAENAQAEYFKLLAGAPDVSDE